jgi:hypothetical protein
LAYIGHADPSRRALAYIDHADANWPSPPSIPTLSVKTRFLAKLEKRLPSESELLVEISKTCSNMVQSFFGHVLTTYD